MPGLRARNVNQELLSRLTLEDNKTRPLPGGTGRRQSNQVDARLSKIAGTTPVSDSITFYEHLATIRYRDPGDSKKDKFFVAFRQTMDALLLEQQDPSLYPEYLMKDPVKKTELKTYIYQVTKHWKEVPILRSHEDWLSHIADVPTFDTIAYFLLKYGIISEEMFGSMS
jgi:hypothetical protein